MCTFNLLKEDTAKGRGKDKRIYFSRKCGTTGNPYEKKNEIGFQWHITSKNQCQQMKHLHVKNNFKTLARQHRKISLCLQPIKKDFSNKRRNNKGNFEFYIVSQRQQKQKKSY